MGTVHCGERNPNWKGGRTVASNGYVLVRRPGHPMADTRGYVYEHRLVASEMLGRLLRSEEQVHHLNGDRLDNSRDNLAVIASLAEHRRLHRRSVKPRRNPGEANPTIHCACGCGAELRRYDDCGRPRRYVSGHNVRK